jgi:hypothetical protein
MSLAIAHLDAWPQCALHYLAVAVNTNPRSIPKNIKRAEGAELRRIWKLRPPMSQAAFATTVLSASAGYLPQIFSGETPLDLRKARLFAEHLKCRIADFSPRLSAEEEKGRSLVTWPFPNLDYEEVSNLDPPEIAKLEGEMRSYLLKLNVASARRGRRQSQSKSI